MAGDLPKKLLRPAEDIIGGIANDRIDLQALLHMDLEEYTIKSLVETLCENKNATVISEVLEGLNEQLSDQQIANLLIAYIESNGTKMVKDLNFIFGISDSFLFEKALNAFVKNYDYFYHHQPWALTFFLKRFNDYQRSAFLALVIKKKDPKIAESILTSLELSSDERKTLMVIAGALNEDVTAIDDDIEAEKSEEMLFHEAFIKLLNNKNQLSLQETEDAVNFFEDAQKRGLSDIPNRVFIFIFEMSRKQWEKIPDNLRKHLIKIALKHTAGQNFNFEYFRFKKFTPEELSALKTGNFD